MRIFIIILITTLTACSHQSEQVPLPSAPLVQATIEVEKLPELKIITIPKLLALPGQLKPIPVKEKSPEKQIVDPLNIVDAVRKEAAYGPEKGHMMNAVQRYPYAEGALYQVYTAVGQVTDIALAKGEVLSSVSAGDTVRWVVGDTTSGSGASLRTHILVKPIAAELNSNLVILTDRRAYHIELHSSETSYMAAVSWHYPHEELITLQRQQRGRMASNAMIAEPKLNLATMSFSYKITGDNPRWRPVRAFDDGAKTYIQFPANLVLSEAPPLFLLTSSGDTALINYRVKGRYYVIDRLIDRAELRMGQKKQQVVRITRTLGDRS